MKSLHEVIADGDSESIFTLFDVAIRSKIQYALLGEAKDEDEEGESEDDEDDEDDDKKKPKKKDDDDDQDGDDDEYVSQNRDSVIGKKSDKSQGDFMGVKEENLDEAIKRAKKAKKERVEAEHHEIHGFSVIGRDSGKLYSKHNNMGDAENARNKINKSIKES